MSVFIYLFMYLFYFRKLLIFYEDHIGNKCTFICYNVFIFANIIYIYMFNYHIYI